MVSQNLPTIHPLLRRTNQEAATAALAVFDSRDGFDAIFECTGAESSAQMSVFTATTGGSIMLIGMGTRSTAAFHEVDTLGSFHCADTYTQALILLPSPSTELRSKLVTHRLCTERFCDVGEESGMVGIENYGWTWCSIKWVFEGFPDPFFGCPHPFIYSSLAS